MRYSLFLPALICAVSVCAQEAPTQVLPAAPAEPAGPVAPLFPTPAYFRQQFTTPSRRVELKAPVRLNDFVVGEKMELSLRSYLELVMANNTDIEIQRVQLEIQEAGILRTFGRFDPVLTGSFTNRRTKQQTSDLLAGAETLNQLNQPTDFRYQQTLQTGTQYNVGFSASKVSTNNAFANFNPALTANFSFGFSQPLLRGRGSYVTRLPLMVARSRYRASEYSMVDQIMQRIVQAENAYWQVVQDRENLRVQEEALKLFDFVLKRAERELELGASSPLDIFQPQADYARAEINVNQAKFRLQQSEDVLRRFISADLDPVTRRLPIVLTEPVLPPTDATEIDPESSVEKAMRFRPDLRSAIQNIDISDLQIQQANNALRPDLALTGSYNSSGRGGTFYERANVFTDTGARTSQIISVIPGGFGDAMSQVFGFGFPTYSFGLTLRLPLRDRAAQADLAEASVNKRLAALRVRSLEQQVRQQVLNAVSQVEASKAAVKLAAVNRDLAEKVRDAEQKKYDLGVNTIFFVLQANQRVVDANALLVTQSTLYRRNLINLLQMTGELLDQRGIVIQ